MKKEIIRMYMEASGVFFWALMALILIEAIIAPSNDDIIGLFAFVLLATIPPTVVIRWLSHKNPLSGCVLIPVYEMPLKREVQTSIKELGKLARALNQPILYIEDAEDAMFKTSLNRSQYAIRHDGIWIMAYDKPEAKKPEGEV